MLQIVHRIRSLNSLTMSMFVDQAQYVTFKGHKLGTNGFWKDCLNQKWLVLKFHELWRVDNWVCNAFWLFVMAGSRFTSGVWLCALLLESTHVTFTSSFIWFEKLSKINPCVVYMFKCTFYKLLPHKDTCWCKYLCLCLFIHRIQIGKAASVKTAATLVRELSYQNKVLKTWFLTCMKVICWLIDAWMSLAYKWDAFGSHCLVISRDRVDRGRLGHTWRW
jgi:hypothetical protein